MSGLPGTVTVNVSWDPDPLDKHSWNVSLFKIDGICSFQISSNSKMKKSCIQIHQGPGNLDTYMGNITLNNKRMCSNCCMRILIATTSFDYFKMNNNLPINLLYPILKHPQILFHFTRRKHKHLFNKFMYILAEYGWYNFPRDSVSKQHLLTVNYSMVPLTQSQYILFVEKVRKKFWLMLELCHSRRYLLKFIKLDYGKYFHEVFMREIQNAGNGGINDTMYKISELIIIKHGKYFKRKIEKHPLRLCYIYLNRFMKMYPDVYIDLNKAKTKRLRSSKEILNVHKKYIYCNNPKCNAKYVDTYQNSKWYKCKGCKMVYYCSRRCQKYDWNKYDHQNLCRYFDTNSPWNPINL